MSFFIAIWRVWNKLRSKLKGKVETEKLTQKLRYWNQNLRWSRITLIMQYGRFWGRALINFVRVHGQRGQQGHSSA